MQKGMIKLWKGIVIFLILGLFSVSVIAGNSILEIINMEKVEKLLAERRENATRELEQEKRLLPENSVDEDESFLHNDDDDYERTSEGDTTENGGESPRLPGWKKQNSHRNWNKYRGKQNRNHSNDGRGYRFRQNFTGIPDVSSLLADFTTVKVDKYLKSEKNGQFVIKKEYLRKDWCKTEPILQKIREDGCLTRTIVNRFCYGQCNSFYIPKNSPRRKKNRKKQGHEEELEETSFFKSCGFCKPKKSSSIFVTLNCPNLMPPIRRKKVQRIKQCKCIAENFN